MISIAQTDLIQNDFQYDNTIPFFEHEKPPFSNTGGIVTHHSISASSALILPPEPFIFFDWFAYTHVPYFGHADSETPYKTLTQMVDDHFQVLSSIVSGLEVQDAEKGYQGYNHHLKITRNGRQAGIIAYGGNAGTIYVSLSGYGCVGVDFASLRPLVEKLERFRITRCDLTFDDLDGQHSIDYWVALYKANGFHIHGAKPTIKLNGDWVNEIDRDGRSAYIGSQKSSKYVLIYEKGKQLGDPISKWVRIEVRFFARDIAIPADIMTSPEKYFAGAYPPFEHLHSEFRRIDAIKKHCDIAFESLLEYGSIAYGKLVWYMKNILFMSDTQIVRKFERQGVPKRLDIASMTYEMCCPVPF